MKLKRRKFLGVLALVFLPNAKVFSKTTSNVLNDFQALLKLKKNPFNHLDENLQLLINNQLNAAWKGFTIENYFFYEIGQKILLPVVQEVKKGTNLYSILCYEKIEDKWITLPSLSNFHIEGILKNCKHLLPEIVSKAVLPKYSLEYIPFGYSTEVGKLFLTINCSHEKNEIHFKVNSDLITSIESTYLSEKLR